MSRKRQSPLEDLIDVTSLLPWWAGLLLAIISYLVLHRFASVEIQPGADIYHPGAIVAKQLPKTLAYFGQMVLPFAFLLGAGVSAYNRWKRQKLFNFVAGTPDPRKTLGKQTSSETTGSVGNILNDMTWHEFEVVVGEFFRRQGYSVRETGGGGADGGGDLRMTTNGQTYLVQCKQWKAFKVGVKVIRELFGIMSAEGAAGAFIVTSGLFTEEAEEFAAGKNIVLLDGLQLREIIRAAKSPLPGASSYASPPSSKSDINPTEETIPFCPQCNAPMVKRVSKKGAYAGKPFWGCSQYPRCKAIVPWH